MNIFRFHPPLILGMCFCFLIAVCTALLKLPISTHVPISWMQAIFTATSAVTVTGLAVVDTAQYTTFGQVVIALHIQAGGLGFMTFAVLAFDVLQRRLSMSSQLVAQEAFGNIGFGKITSTAKSVFLLALTFESVGFVCLSILWLGEYPLGQALYHGFFYTVSAFNNAGFALSSDSLMPFAGNIGINLVITTLIISGGLGFLVWMDIKKTKKWCQFNVNTKVILTATVILNLSAFILFWWLEYDNPETLGSHSFLGQGVRAWFAAITPRTAGFNTIDTAAMTDASTLLTMFLMLIGGGSISTASGIKLGTFVVVVMATWAFIRQSDSVVIFSRKISEQSVNKALALVSISIFMIFFSVFILMVIEESHDFVDVLFEVISALSTVGLSRGLTSQLSVIGEWVLILMMIAGRLGPLTLAYMIALPKSKHVKYPSAQIQVG